MGFLLGVMECSKTDLGWDVLKSTDCILPNG